MIRWLQTKRWISKLHAAKPKTRLDALEHLLSLKPPDLTNLLCSVLQDSDSSVRLAAVRGLEKIGDPQLIDHLSRTLADGNYNVRAEAARVITGFGAGAVEPLITALSNGDAMGRKPAAELLGKIKDTRAIDPLARALADTDPVVREAAASALGEFGKSAVESLINALSDGNAAVRQIAARYLGRMCDTRAIAPLAAILEQTSDSLGGMLGTAETLQETVAQALLNLSQAQPLASSVRSKVDAILQEKERKQQLSDKLRSSFPDSHGSSDQAMLSSSPPRRPW